MIRFAGPRASAGSTTWLTYGRSLRGAGAVRARRRGNPRAGVDARATARGYLAELVSIPFKWYPKDEILPHAAAWRLVDLSESNGRPIDLLIASKFPTYFVRHPNKVCWLIHQYRAAYELCGTPFSDFGHNEQDVGLRDRLIRLDTDMLGECRRLFANARNTANRVAKFNGLTAEPLYHPPRLASRIVGGRYGDYVLSVGRLESVKRVDLIVSAMAHVDRPLRLVVAGDGTQRAATERLAAEAGLDGRVDFSAPSTTSACSSCIVMRLRWSIRHTTRISAT